MAAKLIPLTDTLAMLQLVNLQGEGVPLPLLPRANGHGRVGEVPEDLGHWQVRFSLLRICLSVCLSVSHVQILVYLS